MDSLDKLLQQLLDEKISTGAAFQLAQAQEQGAVTGLIMALKHANPVVRNSGLLGLAETRDSGVVPAILVLLNDPEIYVRASAAFALGKLGDASCVSKLSSCLKVSINVDANLCRQLMVALLDIDEQNCANMIVVGLQSSIAEVRSTAAEFLGHIGNQQTISELSAQLLSEPEEVVKDALRAARSQLQARFAQ
jgi:HEAT repeat protein